MSEKTILVLESRAEPMIRLTPEIRESIAVLKDIPGFKYLLQQLRLQKAFLSNQLEENPHKELRDVDRLQVGLFWIGWLENLVERVTNQPPKVPVEARQLRKSELDMLEEIRANIYDPLREGKVFGSQAEQ